MAHEMKDLSQAEAQQPQAHVEHSNDDDALRPQSKLVRFYAHPWTQILLISLICFCLPGVCRNPNHTPSLYVLMIV
jgi:hypothetical protein